MNVNEFYVKVTEAVAVIQSSYTNVLNSAVCVLLTKDEEIFAAVSNVGIRNGSFSVVKAEFAAVSAMKSAVNTTAVKLALVSLDDNSIITPEKDVISVLFEMNSLADNCEILVSPEETAIASEFIGGINFFAGFDDDMFAITAPSAPSGKDENYISSDQTINETGYSGSSAPQDYSHGVEIDVTNPFYEPSDSAKSDVRYFANIPGENSADAPPPPAAYRPPSEDMGSVPTETISKHDLLKQAKQHKKIAKARFGFRK